MSQFLTIQAGWFYDSLSREEIDELRRLTLRQCHCLLFALQERIVRQLAKTEPDAAELFDHAAPWPNHYGLTDYDIERVWCENYETLACICGEKEAAEIEALRHEKDA